MDTKVKVKEEKRQKLRPGRRSSLVLASHLVMMVIMMVMLPMMVIMSIMLVMITIVMVRMTLRMCGRIFKIR